MNEKPSSEMANSRRLPRADPRTQSLVPPGNEEETDLWFFSRIMVLRTWGSSESPPPPPYTGEQAPPLKGEKTAPHVTVNPEEEEFRKTW